MPTELDRLCRCAKCEAEWQESQLAAPHRLWERLDPGSEVPAGECPECGSLAYLVKEAANA